MVTRKRDLTENPLLKNPDTEVDLIETA